MKKNSKFLGGLILAVAVVAAFFGFGNSPEVTEEGPAAAQVGVSTVRRKTFILSSNSFSEFSNIASQALILVPDPGDNCMLELVSISGMRVFSSEAWQNVDEGFEVKYKNRTGIPVIASFAKGFSSGGELSTVASPAWVIRHAFDVSASPSEPLILTASSSQTIDGDTYFKFDTAYRKTCKF